MLASAVMTAAWVALVGALLLAGFTAVRFIMYGDIVDFISMVVSTICLVLLVAAVTA